MEAGNHTFFTSVQNSIIGFKVFIWSQLVETSLNIIFIYLDNDRPFSLLFRRFLITTKPEKHNNTSPVIFITYVYGFGDRSKKATLYSASMTRVVKAESIFQSNKFVLLSRAMMNGIWIVSINVIQNVAQ